MDRLPGAWFSILALSLALIFSRGNEVWADGNSHVPVRVNGIAIDVPGIEPAVPDILEPGKGKESRAWIVQFDGPVQGADKEHVIRMGVRLLDYLPDFAFLAVMDGATRKEVEKLPFVAGVARLKPAYKLNGHLRNKAVDAAEGDQVRLHLKLDDSAPPGYVMARIQQLNGKVLGVGRDTILVAIDARRIAELAALDEVTWINEHFDMRISNDDTRWVVQTALPNDLRIWNNGLHGEGEVIGIGDTGLDYDMPWFRDPGDVTIGPGHRKLVGYETTRGDSSDADNPGHGTHVAGTVAGDREPVDGLTGGNGMAPKARVFIQDLAAGSTNYINVPSDLAQLFTAAHSAGARLHTNSWGNDSNFYGPYAASSDRYIWEHRDFIALFANGNSGPGSYTTGNPATAKNVISVGASYNGTSAESMAIFSSNGPTADGRIKPTVTAPGHSIVSVDSDGILGSYNSGTVTMSGTSMATPAVAGAAALVRQYFAYGYYPFGLPSPGNAFSPSAALVKAVIINSAQNMTGSNTGGPIPSTSQGWGRINLVNSLPFAGDARMLIVEDEGDGLATGSTWSRQVMVKGGNPLKVTMVWTDYPGATGASKALVNDLDLTVTAPDGTSFRGNSFVNGESFAGGTPDRLNVEEQVLVKTPLPGVYSVVVTGYNVPVGPQSFALAISGAADVTPTGRIELDRQKYNSGGIMLVKVRDSDLNADSARVEQVAIRATSTAKPAGETVVLTETAADSGVYSGAISLAVLQASDGDTITVVYEDADDGSGRAAIVTAAAVVDNSAPVISNIALSTITETGVTITWSSDEPANSELVCRDALGGAATVSDRRLVTNHTITLAGLAEGGTYRFTAQSTDEAGNSTSSGESSFTTLILPPALSVSSSEGGTTYKSTTVISGISTDPSGVAQVTVNGVPASYRRSDGYYTCSVPLQAGDNCLTLRTTDLLGNEAVAGITVTRLLPSDLLMQSVEGPHTAVQGAGITIADTVCNGGQGDAAGFSVSFYLSADQILTGDDTFLGERNVAFLAAGSCSSGVTTHTVPALAPGGTRYLVARADNGARLVETSTSNNSLAGNQVTLPENPIAAPAFISVPATSSTGSITVSFGKSNVSGVTYVLEMATNGGDYAVISSSTNAWAPLTLVASGTYTFRVKVAKIGYTDSGYTAPARCVVTIVCAVPASLTVPDTNASGNFRVYFGSSNVGGVTYVLEQRREGGVYSVVSSGTNAWADIVVTANGIYSFRVKATRAGCTNSGYTAPSTCVVTLACAVPASLTVPATNANGNFLVYFGSSNVGGVTYVLEQSRDGGAYRAVSSGTNAWANIVITDSGVYSYRVKATRAGYADSGYTAPSTCMVTLVCAVPASLTVPDTNASGSFKVAFGSSNVGGVTYVLEQSRDGGAYRAVSSGTNAWANIVVTDSGVYSYRVKATRVGYADSDYTGPANCAVTLVCAAPASLTVPAMSASVSFRVHFGSSNVGGVTYVLEQSRDGGAYRVVSSGTNAWADIVVTADGVYSFRVKATRTGYADSGYTAACCCTVTALVGIRLTMPGQPDGYFTTITAAIAGIVSGTSAQIRTKRVDFAEVVDMNRCNESLTIGPAYDPTFTTILGPTVIRGSLGISCGALVADNLMVI